MSSQPAVVAALIASLASLVASLIGIFNTRKTNSTAARNIDRTISTSLTTTDRTIRANIVSSNRQKWIDSIRDDLADFFSAHEIALAYHASDGMNAKMAEDALVARRKMYLLEKRVELRLNPEEKPHLDFLNHLVELREMNTPWEEAEQRVMRAAQDIFKSEWVRIKRGE